MRLSRRRPGWARAGVGRGPSRRGHARGGPSRGGGRARGTARDGDAVPRAALGAVGACPLRERSPGRGAGRDHTPAQDPRRRPRYRPRSGGRRPGDGDPAPGPFAPRTRVPSARRSRARVLSAAGAAVILAAVAIGVALLQRDRADEAGAAAEAIRLGEVAEAQEDPAVALALVAESLGDRRLPDHPRQRAADVRQLRRPAQYRRTTGRAVAEGRARSDVTGRPDHRHGTHGRDPARGRRPSRPTALSHRPTCRPRSRSPPTGDYLAAGMSEPGLPLAGATVVWDVETGTEVARFDSGEGAVQAHVWAPDGSSVWSLGDDGDPPAGTSPARTRSLARATATR